MEELPTEITAITLNCWGLKYISKQRPERLAEIGRQLAALEPAPSIVALQECWCQEDYRAVRRETRFVLPYGKFYHSGAFGGGLAILSRWPIEESSMVRYPLNGRPTAFWRGDWYVGKGVACAKIRYGPALKQVVEVFNTHTHAPYERPPNDSYLVHRTAQIWELAKLLRGAAERGHLVLALGDLNTPPSSPAHRLLTSLAPVRDVWRVLHPDSALGPADDPAELARRRPIPTAATSLAENGATSDSVLNTWRWTPAQRRRLRDGAGEAREEVPPDALDRRAKRLDYIFASTGDTAALGGGWVVRAARVCLTGRHPVLACSLSDHFGVQATLAFHALSTPPPPPSSSTPPPPDTHTTTTDNQVQQAPPPPRDMGTYLQSPTSTSSHGSLPLPPHTSSGPPDAARQLSGPPLPGEDGAGYVTAAALDEVLAQTRAYMARERRQRRWRGGHFGAGVVGAVGCGVGVWFSPANYVAFVLLVVASLGLVGGLVDGLIALLFVGSEMRALKEFEWEIMNAKAAASGGVPMVEEEGEKGW